MPELILPNTKEMVGGQDDDKPPNIYTLFTGWSSRMVSGFISYTINNSTQQDLSSIDSLYRKSCGTFGIQELY